MEVLHNIITSIVDEYTFEQVEDFKYFGVNLNNRHDMHNETRLKLNAEN